MPSFHEFDVALTPSGPSAAAATSRIPTNEVHLNPWAAGVKGNLNGSILSDATNAPLGIGLKLAPARLTALNNAPAELVLGDASGPWLINLADLNMLPVAATTFSGVFFS
jgi:hypothetical protein